MAKPHLGRKLLLNSLLELYATRVNASYLVLPASQNQKFESIFIPIISHLLQEAQAISVQFPGMREISDASLMNHSIGHECKCSLYYIPSSPFTHVHSKRSFIKSSSDNK